MKKFWLILALLGIMISFVPLLADTITFTPNFWGGYNIQSNYMTIGQTRPNYWGGYNLYNQYGSVVMESRPSYMGGYNFYNSYGSQVMEIRPNYYNRGFTIYDYNR